MKTSGLVVALVLASVVSAIEPIDDPSTFRQVANLLESRTNLRVRGGDYPISESKAQLASALQYTQIGIIGGIMLVGDAYLPPQVRENKFATAMIVWIAGNAVVSSFRNTGAFEIYVGKDLVWSTLAEGRMPNYQDLVTGMGRRGIDLGR